jgi:hypothetical protein
MNSPCQNHGFPVTHLAKDCIAYKKHITQEDEMQVAQDGYWGDCDDDEGGNATSEYTVLIFGGPQAYQDRRLQKLTHRQVYVATLAVPLHLLWSE